MSKTSTQPVLTPEQISAANCVFWVDHHDIRLPDGRFELKGHEYLIEPMSESHRVEVEMKGTQGGFSIKETLVTLHGCIHGYYPKGVAYAMPTEGDVQKFSKTKFTPLIQLNKNAIGKYVKGSGRGSTDSADLKKVGESFIHFIGATLSRKVDGESESSALRSFSCDKFVCDELDMMDLSIIEKLRGRFAASTIKHERYISNPTGENYGIHSLFKDSDQRYWFRLCPHCLTFTSPDLEFIAKPESVIAQDGNGKGVILCKQCRQPIPMYHYDKKTGKEAGYQPLYPGRPIVGRHWSQLNSIYHDPYDLLMAFYNPPEGNFKDVMRYRFGLPYTDKEDQLRESQVMECCTLDPMPQSHTGPCAAGVDVGIVKHVVIGPKLDAERYQIVKIAQVKTWPEVYDLLVKYNVKQCGIDIAPDIDAAKDFQKAMRGKCAVWLCDYKTAKAVGPVGYDEKNFIIKANRTEICDQSHRIIVNRQLILPRAEQCKEFIRQVCDPFKQEKKNAKSGLPEYVYIGKNDHFRHALNYFMLAGNKVARYRPRLYNPQYDDCETAYSVI